MNDSRTQALQTPTHMEPAKCFGGNARVPSASTSGISWECSSLSSTKPCPGETYSVAFVPNDH